MSVQSPFDFDGDKSSNSQDEDNFELPLFKLPGTPVTESEGEGGRTPAMSRESKTNAPTSKAGGKEEGQSAISGRRSSRRSGQPGEEKEEEAPRHNSGESMGTSRGRKEKMDGELADFKAVKKTGECVVNISRYILVEF